MFKWTLLTLAIFTMAGCGSTSSSSGGTSSTGDNAGAAVGAAFSSSSGSSSVDEARNMLLNLFMREALAQENTDTCDSLGEDPGNVTSLATGTTGTYGAASESVTVDADTDFCQDSNGDSNTNTDNLLFASFILTSATVTCGSDTMTMSGTGIWRNRPVLGYTPQVYGSFTLTVDGTATTVDCTMFLGEDETIASSSCSDSDGTAITQDDTSSCTIDAG